MIEISLSDGETLLTGLNLRFHPEPHWQATVRFGYKTEDGNFHYGYHHVKHSLAEEAVASAFAEIPDQIERQKLLYAEGIVNRPTTNKKLDANDLASLLGGD